MMGNNFSYAAALAYGSNTIEVTAEDSSNKTATVKRTIACDNEKPSVSITKPAQDITTGENVVTISGNVTDITGVTVTIIAGDKTYNLPVTDGTFEQAIEFRTENTYSIFIIAVDELGNTSTVQRNIIYSLPKTLEVTIDPSEGGIVEINCPGTCTGIFDAGTTITLTAQPSVGYAFTGWTNCDTTTGKTCTFVLSADRTVTASFIPIEAGKYTVVVFRDGDGNGTVTSSPAGITCNDTDNAVCESTYDKDAKVKLTARTATDSTFKGWSGYPTCEGKTTATCTVTMTDDYYEITATFELIPQNTLNVIKSGNGLGTATAKPGGLDNIINCESDCLGDTATYLNNKTVTLTAKADTGYKFTGWSGYPKCEGKAIATCIVKMDIDYDITAIFEEIPRFTVIVTKDGSGIGSVTGSPKGMDNTAINCRGNCMTDSTDYMGDKPISVTLTAKPDAGSKFTGWGGDAPITCTAKTKTCKLSRLDSDKNVTASFGQPEIDVPATAGVGAVTKGEKTGSTTFMIANTGDAELKITAIKIAGADAKLFKVSNGTTGKSLGAGIIAAGDSLTVKVTFKPKTNGQKTATLTVKSDTGTGSNSIIFTGTGSGF